MRRFDKKIEIKKANMLCEERYLQDMGKMEEDNILDFGVYDEGTKPLDNYKAQVAVELENLDSGDKLIAAMNAGKYDDFLLSNLKRKFPARHTAEHLRDHWYGVSEDSKAIEKFRQMSDRPDSEFASIRTKLKKWFSDDFMGLGQNRRQMEDKHRAISKYLAKANLTPDEIKALIEELETETDRADQAPPSTSMFMAGFRGRAIRFNRELIEILKNRLK